MRRWILLVAIVMLLFGAGCERREGRQPESESEETPSFQEPDEATDSGVSDDSVGILSDPSDQPLSPEAAEVEEAAKALLDAMQAGDREALEELLDYQDFLQLAEGQSDANLLTLLRWMEYEITAAEASGDRGTVTATITNVDMTMSLGGYLRTSMELQYNNSLEAAPKSSAEMETIYEQLFAETLEQNAHHRTEFSVRIRFERQEGVWVVSVDDHLRDAVLGNYFPARAQLGENAGGGR